MADTRSSADPTIGSRPPRRTWRKRLLALGIGWALLELLLPFTARHVPLATRMLLPAPLYILGQRTKAGTVPEDWILVLGDSYSAGSGDWLNAVSTREVNPRFQALDFVHDATGRDLLTFGTGGADNVTATAFQVSKRFAQLRRTGMADPSDVIVYFYAGNDLNDNLRRARRSFELRERGTSGFGPGDLESAVEARATKGLLRGLPGMLYGPYVLQKAFQRSVEAAPSSEYGGTRGKGTLVPVSEVPERTVNRVRVGDAELTFDDQVQAPGLELEGDEVAFAMDMLDESVAWVSRRFPEASLTLVFLPSPLSCYELLSEQVVVRSYEGRKTEFEAARVAERSDELRALAAEIAARRGAAFLDATPALRERARTELVHGPRDGNHLNRAGYEVLGELLVEHVQGR